VWAYLRSLNPVSRQVPRSTLTGAAATTSGSTRAQGIYDVYCRACHGQQGAGSPFTTTPLKNAAHDLDLNALIAFVREGIPGTGMPAFGRTLTREQIGEIAAIVRTW
jgi:mono/diheme cytochrome c family protein